MEEYGYVVNVDGVVVRDQDYLIIERGENEEHASGVLGFPGGKVEESPGTEAPLKKTAVRELAEEVGLSVGGVEYVFSKTFEADDGTHCLNIVTCCEYESGVADPGVSGEVAAVHWLSPPPTRSENIQRSLRLSKSTQTASRSSELASKRPRESVVSSN